MTALHQGAPGQMTWLEDPPPWLPPCLMLCFASVIVWIEHKNFTISDRWPLTALFVFIRKKVHPGDLARGCSDLEMTWLLCCVGAATDKYLTLLAKSYLSLEALMRLWQLAIMRRMASMHSSATYLTCKIIDFINCCTAHNDHYELDRSATKWVASLRASAHLFLWAALCDLLALLAAMCRARYVWYQCARPFHVTDHWNNATLRLPLLDDYNASQLPNIVSVYTI